ncbi:MAG: transposase, partial [candidate division NC10 bacterium]|nr:transposase [candidate division NC10 bacterium]
MSQGLLPYTIEVVPDADGLTSRAGLPLVLETMRALGLDQAIAQHVHLRERQSGYTETAKIEALVLLLAAGGDCLDDIAVLQADGGLRRLLGRRLPSADTLRHFLYTFHDEQLILQAQAARPAGQVAYIPAENAALQGLARVNTALVHQVAAQGRGTQATLDHGATLQESHKQQALPHYKGGRGYQPAAIYWVEQDLVVADEYRDGNVGAGMENLPLIRRVFASLPATVTAFFFRADSACYDERVLKWLANP